MCHFETSWKEESLKFNQLDTVLDTLKELEVDGLLCISDDKITIPTSKRAFVRNICMAFDLRLLRKKPERKLFSMTI